MQQEGVHIGRRQGFGNKCLCETHGFQCKMLKTKLCKNVARSRPRRRSLTKNSQTGGFSWRPSSKIKIRNQQEDPRRFSGTHQEAQGCPRIKKIPRQVHKESQGNHRLRRHTFKRAQFRSTFRSSTIRFQNQRNTRSRPFWMAPNAELQIIMYKARMSVRKGFFEKSVPKEGFAQRRFLNTSMMKGLPKSAKDKVSKLKCCQR